MKKQIALLSLMAAAVLFVNCRTPLPQNPPAWIAVAAAVAQNSAAVGVAMDVQANPNHRAAYQTVEMALTGMIERQNWNAAEFAAVLRMLPVAQLQGPNGVLMSTAIATVYDLATGTLLDVSSSVAAEKIMRSVRDGIRAGLQSTQESTRSPQKKIKIPADAHRKMI